MGEKYTNYINGLLKQKRTILEKLQKQFIEQRDYMIRASLSMDNKNNSNYKRETHLNANGTHYYYLDNPITVSNVASMNDQNKNSTNIDEDEMNEQSNETKASLASFSFQSDNPSMTDANNSSSDQSQQDNDFNIPRRRSMRLQIKEIIKLNQTSNKLKKENNKNTKTKKKRETAKRSTNKSNDKLFKCTYKDCTKSFPFKCLLDIHIKRHLGIKNFKCSVCGKSFVLKQELIRHSRIHLKEKPFKCTHQKCGCNKGYTQKAGLDDHIKRVLGIKNYKCSVCNKAFVSSSELKQHSPAHSGEKPFGCKQCKKRFNHRSGLTHHLKSHHK